jgi:hypothetical protein
MKDDNTHRIASKYLEHLTTTDWILDEAYKFEFANYLQRNIDWNAQTDEEILNVLRVSQTIKYDGMRGVQFMVKGAKDMKNIINLHDIERFRRFRDENLGNINWAGSSMSYPILSSWLSSLFPRKIYPIPAKGFDQTINFLFQSNFSKFPKTGLEYLIQCQPYLLETENLLKNYPLEEIHLKIWNDFFERNQQLNVPVKSKFEQVDWNWVVQDFHIYILRKILNRYKKPEDIIKSEVSDDLYEPIGIEGNSKLAQHMRFERDSTLIRKIKQQALRLNPMLNCQACGFSFYERYGLLGEGFIEAHHKRPLSEIRTVTKTTIKDIDLLCSNCHRMIHKKMSQTENSTILTLEDLITIINK